MGPWEQERGPGCGVPSECARARVCPYQASSMKPMTNLRTSMDLSAWNAMISFQHQEKVGQSAARSGPPHPVPITPSLHSRTSRKLSNKVGSLLMISSWT